MKTKDFLNSNDREILNTATSKEILNTAFDYLRINKDHLFLTPNELSEIMIFTFNYLKENGKNKISWEQEKEFVEIFTCFLHMKIFIKTKEN